MNNEELSAWIAKAVMEWWLDDKSTGRLTEPAWIDLLGIEVILVKDWKPTTDHNHLHKALKKAKEDGWSWKLERTSYLRPDDENSLIIIWKLGESPHTWRGKDLELPLSACLALKEAYEE